MIARWKDSNVGRLPITVDPWGSCDEDTLNVRNFCGGLIVSAIFAYEKEILIVVHRRGRMLESWDFRVYLAKDWALLCRWEMHREFNHPRPDEPMPSPYLKEVTP